MEITHEEQFFLAQTDIGQLRWTAEKGLCINENDGDDSAMFIPLDFGDWDSCDLCAYTDGLAKVLEFMTYVAHELGIYNFPYGNPLRGSTSAEGYVRAYNSYCLDKVRGVKHDRTGN